MFCFVTSRWIQMDVCPPCELIHTETISSPCLTRDLILALLKSPTMFRMQADLNILRLCYYLDVKGK